MNRYLLLPMLLLLAACTANPEPEVDPRPAEMRGVWITNVDSEVLFTPGGIEQAMDYLADRGFNLIFPVVWNKGYTLYPSQVMADYFGEEYRIDPLFAEQQRDPLAELIIHAHRRGMEVMPWFEFGFASSFEADGGHLIAMRPEWAARDSTGALLKKNGFEWMNAIHPEVQDFMLALVREVAENYDVDGIQGDDRLPAMPSEGGYSDFTRTLYEQETGRTVPDSSREPHFLQWKSDKLSDFGGRLYEMVKSVNPDLIVSLSPSVYDWSKREYLQDSPEWIRRGQVDILHPQAYRYAIERYLTTVDDVARYSGYMAMDDGSMYVDRTGVYVSPGVLIKSGPRYNETGICDGGHGTIASWDLDGKLVTGRFSSFYEEITPLPMPFWPIPHAQIFSQRPAVQRYRANQYWRFPPVLTAPVQAAQYHHPPAIGVPTAVFMQLPESSRLAMYNDVQIRRGLNPGTRNTQPIRVLHTTTRRGRKSERSDLQPARRVRPCRCSQSLPADPNHAADPAKYRSPAFLFTLHLLIY